MIILRQNNYSIFGSLFNRNNRQKNTSIDNSQEPTIKFADISKQHKTIDDIASKIHNNSQNINGLDGDEYPNLTLYKDSYHTGNISLGGNESWEEYKWNGKNWEEANTPTHKIIPNIKSELVKKLEYYKKEYQTNPYGWDEDSLNGVLRHIDTQINEIKRSNL